MAKDLNEINWLEELGNKNVNQQRNIFKNKVIELQNKHIPHKYARNEKNKGVIGLDLETLKVIKKKHRCWTRYLVTEYCKLRNKVRNLTRKVIKSKEKEIAKHIKDNPKKCWHYTQSRMKTRTGISDLILKTENSWSQGRPSNSPVQSIITCECHSHVVSA